MDATRERILFVFGFNLRYAKALLADLPADRATEQPAGLMNHPVWHLGHLCFVFDLAGRMLGEGPICPRNWKHLFGQGTTPENDPAKYPPLAELAEKLEAQHTRLAEAYRNFPEDPFDTPIPDEKVRAVFGTVGNLVVFLLTGHEMTHLGQICAWRRAMGLGRVGP